MVMGVERKYILTDETKVLGDSILHRIQAVRDFGNVKVGDLGGWIEKEDNLSHENTCWVYDEACVCDEARVYDKAQVRGTAWVTGHAKVYDWAILLDDAWAADYAKVCETAVISENARIIGRAIVDGNARILGITMIRGKAHVTDHAFVSGRCAIEETALVADYAKVTGKVRLSGNVQVYGYAHLDGEMTLNLHEHISKGYIKGASSILCIGPLGSRNDYTTFIYSQSDKKIYVCCGCFHGTLQDFRSAVEVTHKQREDHPDIYADYMDACDFVEKRFNRRFGDSVEAP